MTVMSAVFSLVCLIVAALHVVRLAVLRDDVVGEASHAAMGIAMAAMFSPLGDPVPRQVWTAVFAVSAAYFTVLLLRRREAEGSAARHHVVGSAAMLFMIGAGTHAGHATSGGGIGLGSVAAIVLAGYFAWHALGCLERVNALPGLVVSPAGSVALRAAHTGERTAAGAHLVLAVAMSVMLLGMV
jgi:uncharacterized protein DUF5134